VVVRPTSGYHEHDRREKDDREEVCRCAGGEQVEEGAELHMTMAFAIRYGRRPILWLITPAGAYLPGEDDEGDRQGDRERFRRGRARR